MNPHSFKIYSLNKHLQWITMPTYKAMTFLKNTNLAPAPKINLCGKVTHPTATSINEDP